MKNFLKTLAALALTAVATNASANTQTISCGDHWFSVTAVVTNSSAEVTLSGDSVIGGDLSFEATVELVVQNNEAVWQFAFGEGAEEQKLFVEFIGDQSFGLGRHVQGSTYTDMNCYR